MRAREPYNTPAFIDGGSVAVTSSRSSGSAFLLAFVCSTPVYCSWTAIRLLLLPNGGPPRTAAEATIRARARGFALASSATDQRGGGD